MLYESPPMKSVSDYVDQLIERHNYKDIRSNLVHILNEIPLSIVDLDSFSIMLQEYGITQNGFQILTDIIYHLATYCNVHFSNDVEMIPIVSQIYDTFSFFLKDKTQDEKDIFLQHLFGDTMIARLSESTLIWKLIIDNSSDIRKFINVYTNSDDDGIYLIKLLYQTKTSPLQFYDNYCQMENDYLQSIEYDSDENPEYGEWIRSFKIMPFSK